MPTTKPGVNWHVLPIIDEKSIPVYLVLQGEVEGEVFNLFIVVDLHFGGILICLKVFDDIREPNRQAIIPASEQNRVFKTQQFRKKHWFQTEFRERRLDMNSI